MKHAMTPKERWLAAIALQPVDRLPFWPKLGASYAQTQLLFFRDMELNAIHEQIGSDNHAWLPGMLQEARKKTSVDTTQTADKKRTVYRTPHGELALLCHFDTPSASWHPVEFPVRGPADIAVMTEVFRDITVGLDPEGLEKARSQSARLGENAVTASNIGESPLMDWVEWLAGVEMGHYLLADCQAEVEALFDAMQAVLKRKAELLCAHSPADLLYLTENTSTTLISPEQYQRYCARHVGDCAALLDGAGRNLVLHMCGHIKALLPQLAKIPARAFEAFTSPTLGNTTLLDGRTQCPDKCLIGGTNAMLWTRPAGEIIRQIERDLAELPHHRGIVVTSAGVMPPLCPPDTIRQVAECIHRYPARMG